MVSSLDPAPHGAAPDGEYLGVASRQVRSQWLQASGHRITFVVDVPAAVGPAAPGLGLRGPRTRGAGLLLPHARAPEAAGPRTTDTGRTTSEQPAMCKMGPKRSEGSANGPTRRLSGLPRRPGLIGGDIGVTRLLSWPAILQAPFLDLTEKHESGVPSSVILTGHSEKADAQVIRSTRV